MTVTETSPEISFHRTLGSAWEGDEEKDIPTTTTTTGDNDASRRKDPTKNKKIEPSLTRPTKTPPPIPLSSPKRQSNIANRMNIDNEDSKNKNLWERYDLTDGITSRDMIELEMIKKQVDRSPKVVPYSGMIPL